MTLIKHEPLAAEPAFSPEDSYQQHHQQCTENEIFLTLQALYPSVSPERLLPWLEECILQSSQLRTGEGGARRYECVMCFGLQVDRGNLVQAVADNYRNLLDDFNLTTNSALTTSKHQSFADGETDYNLGNVIFLLSFLAAELPSQLVSKKPRPDRWIPMQIALWVNSSLTSSSGCPTSAHPESCPAGSASSDNPLHGNHLTSLLAFGILHMCGVLGLAGWRWLFLLEGLNILLFRRRSSSVLKVGSRTTRLIRIVVNRVLRYDPSKGPKTICTAVKPSRLVGSGLWNAARDYGIWPLYAIGLVAYIRQSPTATYISLNLKSLGFSTFNVNLLSIPYNNGQMIGC
ncbi:allantoate permease [Drepanopeziza brunnea f. sp. 'multigermtubi' MB_m1]|uniref:Allantoate permease n=1 Tax=Marssonina brunnea f. sp. multigermtubi (strain MB_m1) TaxID=1072389 RepID=K1WVZ4_MARBU|nr:allantoate permease [Drepanopeziza brunnea f. sp. 'multigermtubi' MB_m1]EKD17151.1 allantoate permease [Drepanopeziza brunnea f. sp. 'multigermtubi' MB_m1]